jgi:hypothetical protein
MIYSVEFCDTTSIKDKNLTGLAGRPQQTATLCLPIRSTFIAAKAIVL